MTAARKHLRRVGVMSALVCLAMGAAASPADAVPAYHSPGYKGTRKAPRRTPPTPAVIGQNGQKPSVLVDAAGTAHVVWNEPHDDGPDLLRYCRVPRGARSCTASAAL